MIAIRAYRWTVPLALAAVLGLLAAASAQQSPPAKDAKPATKSTKAKNPRRRPHRRSRRANRLPPIPAPGGGQPTLLGQFGDWGAYTATNAGKKVCYALAKPLVVGDRAGEPAARSGLYFRLHAAGRERAQRDLDRRSAIRSSRAPRRAPTSARRNTRMYTQHDGAWVKNAAEEARMVDTMRRGSDMVISGESGRGTKSTDRYALKGLAPGARPRRAGVPVARAAVFGARTPHMRAR